MHCDWQGKFAWMPENLWQQLEPLLPKYPRRSKVGRPRANLRRRQWYSLSVAHRLPVEGTPPTIWQPQYGSSLFPRVDTPGYLAAILEAGAAEVRSETRHRLAMAVGGRRDNQVAAGRGKKAGKIPPIAVSWGSNDRY